MNRTQIVQLNSALKDVIEFRRYEEERGGFPTGAVAAGVGAAGVGAGAYFGDRAIMNRYGMADDGFGNLIRKTNPGARGDAYKAAWKEGSGLVSEHAGRTKGLGKQVWDIGKRGFKALRGIRYSAGNRGIVELNAQLREVLTFGEAE